MNETRERTEASARDGDSVPRLVCHPLEPDPPALEPAQSGRPWMDATTERFAYRCLPLSMANASGWQLLSPVAFEATWSGASGIDAVRVRSTTDPARTARFAVSHFGEGVLTFHTGWLFRTSPGWALWVRGAPNVAKRHLVPLDGLVETDWLEFPFTMNWRFTRAGTVRFEKGEPFCFLTLAPHGLLDRVEPEIRPLDDDPALQAAYGAYAARRADFNGRLATHDPAAVADGWQRTYMRGEASAGPGGFHRSKRRLRSPR